MASIVWTKDTISPKLAAANLLAKGFLSSITERHALAAEGYMKVNAPWTDRTGNARNGLTATADLSQAGSGTYIIHLYHKVPYGIWLETRFAGRYAIIWPAVEHEAPLFQADANQLMRAMFG